MISALDQRPRGRRFEASAGRGRRAVAQQPWSVGQLLFALMAWAYSTFHPFGVGK